MSQEELQKNMIEFEKNRNQLGGVSQQKQQLQFQKTVLEKSLEEMKNSKEEKVYKLIGNIMVLKVSKDVQKELEEQGESVGLRLKTLQKQEDQMVEKLNSLRQKIESQMKEAETSEKK